MASQNPTPERPVRRSWKEIADHLGVSVRAVQAWEKERGLPVRRLGTGTRARVFAYADELDDWRKRVGPTPDGRVRSSRALVASFAFLGILGLAVAGWLGLKAPHTSESREPAVSRLEGHVLVVRDRDGNILWNREFPEAYPVGHIGGWDLIRPVSWVQDLDGDGRPEVLFSLNLQDRNRNSILYCFEHDGRLRWSHTFAAVKSFDGRQFRGFRGYLLELLSVGDAGYLLAVAYHHFFPSLLVLLDPISGEVVGRYSHPGHIRAYAVADLDGDGLPELLVAGDNNPGQGLGHAFVAVLDLPFPSPNPQLPDLFGAPSIQARRYLLLPKIDFCEAVGELASPTSMNLDGDRVRVLVHACNRGSAQYVFDRSLTPLKISLCDAFRAFHDEAFRDGLVPHPLDEDPGRSLLRVVEFSAVPDANSEEVARAFAACRENPDVRHCFAEEFSAPDRRDSVLTISHPRPGEP